MDDNVGFRGGFGDDFGRVVVSFDDLDVGELRCEGGRDVAEEDGDFVFWVGGDKSGQDGATDVAGGAGAAFVRNFVIPSRVRNI